MTEEIPRILLIEDDENDEFFLCRALRNAGGPEPSHVSRDGEDAIATMERLLNEDSGMGRKLPHLVFLDLHLPGRSGLEVLSWMRRQLLLEKTIVVLLTGSREEITLNTAYELGANAYIVKPPSPDSLHVLLKALDRYEVEFETG